MIVAALALLGSAWTTGEHLELPSRTVPVAQDGGGIAARYEGRIRIETRQIGISPPNRQSTARCLWRGVLAPSRTVTGDAAGTLGALSRSFAPEVVASGSQAGECMTANRSIAKQIARHSGRAEERLAALADQDRSALSADIAALQAGPSRPAD